MTDRVEDLLRAHLKDNSTRFDRLEEKIDTLSDVVVSLARAETKLIALEDSRHEQGTRLGRVEREAYQMREDIADNTSFRNGLIKLFWIGFSGVATVLIGLYFKGVI
jgi:hypothetical protein